MSKTIDFPEILAQDATVIEIADEATADFLVDTVPLKANLDRTSSKWIHFLGYGYCAEDGTETPYRILNYSFFIRNLAEIQNYGSFLRFEGHFSEDYKQYLSDVSYEDAIEAYKTWDNGQTPKLIREEDINDDTPEGIYIVIEKK